MGSSRKAGIQKPEQLGLFTDRALAKLGREDDRLWKTLFAITIENRVTLHLSLATLRTLRKRWVPPPDPSDPTGEPTW